jgi:hypothetical protein
MIDGFMLGIIVAGSMVASAYFFKFWHKTRDPLFLSFGAAFLIEGLNRTAFLFVTDPEGGDPVIYSVRLLSYLLILTGIAYKNRSR